MLHFRTYSLFFISFLRVARVCHTIQIFIMAYPCYELWYIIQYVILFVYLVETFIPRPSLGEI